MFWNKKPDPLPHVYLEIVEQVMAEQGAKPTRIKNGVSMKGAVTQSELTWHPEKGEEPAHFKVSTRLSGIIEDTAQKLGYRMNSFASIGALTAYKDGYFVQSRLTLLEGDDAGEIHIPLLAAALSISADTLFRGMARSVQGQVNEDGTSDWTDQDIAQAGELLERLCVCNYGDGVLTAEFGLDPDSVSVVRGGDHNTAMLQISTEERHPDIGPGLFIVLQMPHRIKDEKNLERVIDALNRAEAKPLDSPPHFGAWCAGATLGDNPSYVTFLPNGLHIPGIAANFAIWNFHRAQIAAAQLAALGVHA